MFNKPVREINAEYQAEEKSLPAIQNLVRETCINADMSRKDVNSVILAIEEGVTNIIRHAYLYEAGMIRIRIVVYRKRIVFSLIDYGRSFQPDGEVSLDLKKLADSGRKGGLGFYMIRKIMDSVEYLPTQEFNELRMSKVIARSPEAARLLMGRMFTLRVKFSLYTFLIMLTIIAGSYIFINKRTTVSIHRQLHEKVASLSKTVARQAGNYILNNRSDVEFNDLVRSYIRANPELITIVLADADNKILADTRGYQSLHRPYRPPIEIAGVMYGRPQSFQNDKDLNYLVNPIRVGENDLGRVHIVYTGKMMNEMISQERIKIILLTIIGLAFGIGGIYLLSDYFVAPIGRIVERVRKYSSGDIETELPLEGVEEFFEISKAFNVMISRLRRDHKNIIDRERVAKEIEVAGEIQKTLLPNELPAIPKLKTEAVYRGASRISGDLYDVFEIGRNQYCLLVADVSGKGIPASLIMSVLRTVIRIYARGKKSSHDILTAVNNYIKNDIPPGIFITIFLAVYDIRNEKLNFVSAGHNPLIYYKKNKQQISLINPPGVPLGMPFENHNDFAARLKQQFIHVDDGDVLFVYSDGITEAMNRGGEKYGLKRLENMFKHIVVDKAETDPAVISESILEDIDGYCGLADQADDITFIIVCRANEKKDRPDSRIATEKVEDREPGES